MRKFTTSIVLLFLLCVFPAFAQESRGFVFVELNCENLFDCQHDSLKEDNEYLPDGANRWTPARYWRKINNIAQEILSCGDEPQQNGIPDLVALCEIENDSVLRDLTQRSVLRNAKYQYLITSSPDQRGVDVGLLYSPLSFAVISNYSLRITPRKGMRPTRDILYVKGRTAYDDTLHVFVVHAPSRSGGEKETRPNRRLVIDRLGESVDSLYATDSKANIIIAGDFNDYSTDRNMKELLLHRLTEASKDAKGKNGAMGTYKFQGEWDSLDHIFVSHSIEVEECRINDTLFLLSDDDVYGGKQPFRTYRGPKWSPGFSDHLPLVMKFALTK